MKGKLTGGQRLFFCLCWLMYFATYLGRLNYAASLAKIGTATGLGPTQLGMVSSGFFVSYGLFQVVWGILGDRWNPIKLLFWGVFFSGVCNLAMAFADSAGAMTAIWALNGVAQSAVWSPLLRLTVMYLPQEQAMACSLGYSSTVPLGTFAAYGLCALWTGMGQWHLAFLVPGVVLMGLALIWRKQMRSLALVSAFRSIRASGPKLRGKCILLLLPLALGAAVNGLVRDAIQTWMPTYLNQRHGVGGVSAILLTLVLPLVNLGGVYLGKAADDRLFHSQPLTAGAILSLTGLVLTALDRGLPLGMELALLGFGSAMMLAVNTLLVTMVPMALNQTGRVSTLSGLMNGATYAGSALSGYGFGAMLETGSWQTIRYAGAALCLLAALLCGLGAMAWKKSRL